MDTYPNAQGQIVRMVSVGTDKSFRCYVDFPIELAEQIIASFGYATNAKPIPVVMAGLTSNASGSDTIELMHAQLDAKFHDVPETG